MLGEILAHVVGFSISMVITYMWLIALYILMAFFDMSGRETSHRKTMWFLQLSIVLTTILPLTVSFSSKDNPASDTGLIAMTLGYLVGIALYLPHHRYGFFRASK